MGFNYWFLFIIIDNKILDDKFISSKQNMEQLHAHLMDLDLLEEGFIKKKKYIYITK